MLIYLRQGSPNTYGVPTEGGRCKHKTVAEGRATDPETEEAQISDNIERSVRENKTQTMTAAANGIIKFPVAN